MGLRVVQHDDDFLLARHCRARSDQAEESFRVRRVGALRDVVQPAASDAVADAPEDGNARRASLGDHDLNVVPGALESLPSPHPRVERGLVHVAERLLVSYQFRELEHEGPLGALLLFGLHMHVAVIREPVLDIPALVERPQTLNLDGDSFLQTEGVDSFAQTEAGPFLQALAAGEIFAELRRQFLYWQSRVERPVDYHFVASPLESLEDLAN